MNSLASPNFSSKGKSTTFITKRGEGFFWDVKKEEKTRHSSPTFNRKERHYRNFPYGGKRAA